MSVLHPHLNPFHASRPEVRVADTVPVQAIFPVVSKSTVQGIVQHRERTGTVRPIYNMGNKHKLSAQDERRMIRHVKASPKQTADQIADYMQISASTVRRILSSHGYFRARCRRKPILSAKNIKDRLAWAAANEK